MAEQTNPMVRLMALLQKLRGQKQEQSVYDTWCQVLGAEDTSGFAVRFAHALSLYDDAVASGKSIAGVVREIHLLWVKPVSRLFNPKAFHQPWRDLNAILTDNLLLSMKACEHLLAQQDQETLIPTTEIEALRKEIQEMRTTVESAEIDDDVKKFVQSRLLEIDVALSIYSIRGAEAIRESIGQAMGMTLLNPELLRTQNSASVAKNFVNLLRKIASKVVTGVAQRLIEHAVTSAIGGDAPAQPGGTTGN